MEEPPQTPIFARQKSVKICTAVEIYFVHSAPIVAPQCKFISTAVRFLTYFLAPVGTGFHACPKDFPALDAWEILPRRHGRPTGRPYRAHIQLPLVGTTRGASIIALCVV